MELEAKPWFESPLQDLRRQVLIHVYAVENHIQDVVVEAADRLSVWEQRLVCVPAGPYKRLAVFVTGAEDDVVDAVEVLAVYEDDLAVRGVDRADGPRGHDTPGHLACDVPDRGHYQPASVFGYLVDDVEARSLVADDEDILTRVS